PHALLERTSRAVLQLVSARSVVRGSAGSLAQEVIKAMAMTRWWKVASILLVAAAMASGFDLLPQKGAQGEKTLEAIRDYDGPVLEVKPGRLTVSVIERGSLE